MPRVLYFLPGSTAGRNLASMSQQLCYIRISIAVGTLTMKRACRKCSCPKGVRLACAPSLVGTIRNAFSAAHEMTSVTQHYRVEKDDVVSSRDRSPRPLRNTFQGGYRLKAAVNNRNAVTCVEEICQRNYFAAQTHHNPAVGWPNSSRQSFPLQKDCKSCIDKRTRCRSKKKHL